MEREFECPECGGTITEYTEKRKGGWYFSIQVCTDCGYEDAFEHSDGNRPEDLL